MSDLFMTLLFLLLAGGVFVSWYYTREPILLFVLFTIGWQVYYYTALAFGWFGDSATDVTFRTGIIRPAQASFAVSLLIYFVNGHLKKFVHIALARGKTEWTQRHGLS